MQRHVKLHFGAITWSIRCDHLAIRCDRLGDRGGPCDHSGFEVFWAVRSLGWQSSYNTVEAMGISFPTHLARASGSQYRKLRSVLKKKPTDRNFFLEASSYSIYKNKDLFGFERFRSIWRENSNKIHHAKSWNISGKVEKVSSWQSWTGWRSLTISGKMLTISG